ncbi:hypothetical protein [Streptomyces sudanensis]|uniref:hypothetical protein n=1 Tax=Streptomyces sudanensis TaxID=436397 RepID=UPI0020CD83D1|nr:hypothetical protein [Streptomyces sudanensis]MCP9956196.1 hypothetical protein [Streptomyces sudanensis]MCQ0003169.1 hypothetical protein [Streptomyces sudanensis]
MDSHSSPSRPTGSRTLRTHAWMRVAGVALLTLGLAGCQEAGRDGADAVRTAAPRPTPTVTVTTTVTATARPAPTPTVTRTKTVTRPGPTVTVTETAQAARFGSSGSDGGGSDGSGTCSIVSNSGNCYKAGQFCRNSDHGADTTTAGGTRITCTYSANAWRWVYS